MELRSLLPALIDDSPWRSPVFETTPRRAEYLVIVARSDPRLFEYLSRQFAGEPHTEVRLDRRGTGGTSMPPGGVDRRRAARPGLDSELALASCGVAVIRRVPVNDEPMVVAANSHLPEGLMDQALDERHRVDRWLEESQYLIGRLIPAFLEDRDRLRSRLEGAEQESDRLRQEVGELRRELGMLQAEVQFYRSEQQAAAETFAGMISHLADMQKPMQEMYRRLQSAPPSPIMAEVHSPAA